MRCISITGKRTCERICVQANGITSKRGMPQACGGGQPGKCVYNPFRDFSGAVFFGKWITFWHFPPYTGSGEIYER